MSEPATPSTFVADELYTQTAERISNLIADANTINVLAYWDIGQLIVEKLDTAENRYGAGIVERISADMAKTGKLISISTLYSCCATYRNYSDRTGVEEMSRLGLTASHLRSLSTVKSAELRREFEGKLLLPDGGVMSVRDLDKAILAKRAAVASERLATLEKEEESGLGDDPGNSRDAVQSKRPSKQSSADEGPSADSTGTGTDGTGGGEQKPITGTPPAKTEKDPKKQPKSTPDTYTESPIKVFKQALKTVDKIIATHSASVFLAAKEYNKIGYDSDNMVKNTNQTLGELRSALVKLKEHLPELISAIDDSLPKV